MAKKLKSFKKISIFQTFSGTPSKMLRNDIKTDCILLPQPY